MVEAAQLNHNTPGKSSRRLPVATLPLRRDGHPARIPDLDASAGRKLNEFVTNRVFAQLEPEQCGEKQDGHYTAR
jgi:hypothetical protein